MKKYALLFVFLYSAFIATADEGMYPINMLSKAPLNKAGLKVSAEEIYNPGNTALMQAVVQIGGCTGSFISGKGLIITNHHCAFGGLEPYSTPENNLLEKGYVASDSSIELPIKGLTVKILISFRDVSEEVLAGTDTIKNASYKRKYIEAVRDIIRKKESAKNPDMLIEIAEMLPGKSYMLFRYTILKDIRIVYIPARNIGEFGGESDNWVWPRHTGDFSFVRAYIGKDGKPAEYNKTNVVYQPKIFFNVSAAGLQEKDFVFILGYPGRTFRHQPSGFMNLHEQFQLPYISDLYEWEINTIKSLGKKDPDFMIRNEPKIKQLANVMKNYRGKLKAIHKLQLYEKRKDEEKQIAQKLSGTEALKYTRTIKKIDSLYAKSTINYRKYMWYNQLFAEGDAINIARNINEFSRQYLIVDEKEEEKLVQKFRKTLREDYKTLFSEYDIVFMNKMFEDAQSFSDENIPSSRNFFTEKNPLPRWLEKTYTKSKILDSNYIFTLMEENPYKLTKLKKSDGFLKLAILLASDFNTTDSFQSSIKNQTDALLPEYVSFRMQAQGQQFIPDANRTLRLTYGNICGYEPYDGANYQAFTNVSGMQEKNGMEEDYVLNNMIKELVNKKTFGYYKLKDKDDLPLCFLYNTDTTGGNSGSPVLNKYGQLVGVNFDRCYEATVNDYNWSETYSRSIGVDIRFVLWCVKYVAKSDRIINEMYVEK